ncbi:TPA: tail fiber protein [Escherichia coli]|nr:tail fiber protein [Escherichia coli]
MLIVVSDTSAVTLKIDPSVVLATREYVDEKVGDIHYVASPAGELNTGAGVSMTTEEFLSVLEVNGAFDTSAWTARCSFVYAKNNHIPDAETGCGVIPLAGAVVEVFSDTRKGFRTIRVTTATTSDITGATTGAEFIYTNNGSIYKPGWRRAFNTMNQQSGSATATKLETPRKIGGVAFDGSADIEVIPVGVPLPWPSATPPTGWLKCNGATFDRATYPQLAKVYTSGKLPDLRGEFIRGWDDGRGVDSDRTLLSAQGSLSFDHRHFLPTSHGSGGDGSMFVLFNDDNDAMTYYPEGTDQYNPYPSTGLALQTYSAGHTVGRSKFGDESRPRNIAFNYIVRAA